MGKALIFKNADFSANSIGTLDSATITTLGTSSSLWGNAATNLPPSPNTYYGFLNTTNGYVTSVTIRTKGALSFKVVVARGAVITMSESLATVNTSAANTTLTFSPLQVKNGDYIGIKFESTGGVFKDSGGNIATYTMRVGGNHTQDTNNRILPYNFKITSFV